MDTIGQLVKDIWIDLKIVVRDIKALRVEIDKLHQGGKTITDRPSEDTKGEGCKHDVIYADSYGTLFCDGLGCEWTRKKHDTFWIKP